MGEEGESPFEPSNRTFYDPTLDFQGEDVFRTGNTIKY